MKLKDFKEKKKSTSMTESFHADNPYVYDCAKELKRALSKDKDTFCIAVSFNAPTVKEHIKIGKICKDKSELDKITKAVEVLYENSTVDTLFADELGKVLKEELECVEPFEDAVRQSKVFDKEAEKVMKERTPDKVEKTKSAEDIKQLKESAKAKLLDIQTLYELSVKYNDAWFNDMEVTGPKGEKGIRFVFEKPLSDEFEAELKKYPNVILGGVAQNKYAPEISYQTIILLKKAIR